MAHIKAPFTKEQVQALKEWQDGTFTFSTKIGDRTVEVPGHPFTCCSFDGCDRQSQPHEGALIPTVDGWVCPCGKWKQDWCHDFMCER